MAWPSGWTIEGGTLFQEWDAFLQHLYRACLERAAAAGRMDTGEVGFPRHSWVWEKGVITSMTATTLGDSTKTWHVPADGWDNPWTDGALNVPYAPGGWAVVIDDPDPRKIIRAGISTWTANTLTIGDITSQITERRISAVSELVGKRYRIIKSAGTWWGERWMKWPNSNIWSEGTITVSTSTSATDEDQSWTPGEHAGRDLMVQEASVLKRIPISGNTADTLQFADPGFTPTGDYYIVSPNAYFQWGRTPDPWEAWYQGKMRQFWTHHPDDTLDTTVVPTETVTYSIIDGFSCSPESFSIFDIDHWSDITETCSEPDDPKNPDMFRTIRGIQRWILKVSEYFVKGSGVGQYTPAQLMTDAGMAGATWASTTVSGGSMNITPPIGVNIPPYTPIKVWYTVLSTTAPFAGQPRRWGEGTYDAGVLTKGDGETDWDGADANKTVIISYGPTRWVPRTFRYWYPKTIFVPSLDGAQLPVDPPTSTYPGEYITRAASTNYLDHDEIGQVDDSGDAFANGDLALYVGDNANDPTVFPRDRFEVTLSRPEGYDVLTPYYHRFYRGLRAEDTQAALDAQRSGTATGGSSRALQDTSKTWWTGDFYTGGTLLTETGTASSGSTTSLTDSGKSGNGFWADNWLVGLIVEVQDAGGTWHARPITTSASLALGWSEALSFSANGRPYRIKFPKYERDRFKDHIVRITHGGATTEHTVSHSDNDTLYFNVDLGFVISAGDTYSIEETEIGTVWLRDAGEWTVPEGIDERGDVPFKTDQRFNLPTMVRNYGLYMKGDYVLTTLFAELKAMLNLLTKTWHDFNWTPKGENNKNQGRGEFVDPTYPGGPDAAYADAKAFANAEWDSNINLVSIAGAPTVYSDTQKNCHNDDETYFSVVEIVRQTSYAQLALGDGIKMLGLTGTVNFFCYSIITGGDPNPGHYDSGLLCARVEEGGEYNKTTDYAFNAHGDPVTFRTWSVAGSAPADTLVEVLVGNGNPPGKPSILDPEDPGNRRFEGYAITHKRAVVSWNLTYV